MDIDSRKFSHPHLTANGEPRACIALTAIKTVFNLRVNIIQQWCQVTRRCLCRAAGAGF